MARRLMRQHTISFRLESLDDVMRIRINEQEYQGKQMEDTDNVTRFCPLAIEHDTQDKK